MQKSTIKILKDKIYAEFDQLGKNKSYSVLQSLRKQYEKLSDKNLSSTDIFYKIGENIRDIVEKSKNYVEMPYEELSLYIDILVVDAFSLIKRAKKRGCSKIFLFLCLLKALFYIHHQPLHKWRLYRLT